MDNSANNSFENKNEGLQSDGSNENQQFSSPLAHPQDSSGNELLIDNGGQDEANPVANKHGTTPAITKLKQTRKEFQFYSPSDQLMSPCTRKLEKCRPAGGVTFSHPQNILRARHHVQLASSKNCLSDSDGFSSSTGNSSASPVSRTVPLDDESFDEVEKQEANQEKQNVGEQEESQDCVEEVKLSS